MVYWIIIIAISTILIICATIINFGWLWGIGLTFPVVMGNYLLTEVWLIYVVKGIVAIKIGMDKKDANKTSYNNQKRPEDEER